jgi:hypothetical protein
MSLEDHTLDKTLTCGTGHSKLDFGYNFYDSDFFKQNFSHIESIDKPFYRFICSQYNFVPAVEYHYSDIDEITLRSLSMGLEHRRDMTMQEKYKYFNDKIASSPKTACYHCDDEKELLLSELHYYVENNYRLTKCALCGKPFFTRNLKNKFCQRKGFDLNRPHLSCNKIQALRRNTSCASAPTKRKRKVIITTLSRDGADYNYRGNQRIEKFIKQENLYKKNTLEYEKWIDEMYKKFIPNGKL